jgi:hypothetical protein
METVYCMVGTEFLKLRLILVVKGFISVWEICIELVGHFDFCRNRFKSLLSIMRVNESVLVYHKPWMHKPWAPGRGSA